MDKNTNILTDFHLPDLSSEELHTTEDLYVMVKRIYQTMLEMIEKRKQEGQWVMLTPPLDNYYICPQCNSVISRDKTHHCIYNDNKADNIPDKEVIIITTLDNLTNDE